MTKAKSQLQRIFEQTQQQFLADLQSGRSVIDHPREKGQVTENDWIALMYKHLPEPYKVDRAFIVDSEDKSS